MTASTQQMTIVRGDTRRTEKKGGHALENTFGVLMFIAAIAGVWQAVHLLVRLWLHL